MPLLDIVYCYVDETIPFTGDFERLRRSFVAGGFKEVKVNETKWKYTRGTSLGLEFNYHSDDIQMQVFLERPDEDSVKIIVGNWGFPFEPLLMKKRFIQHLQQFVEDISKNQIIQVSKTEVENITKGSHKKFTYAIIVLAVLFFIYFTS